MVEKLDGCLLVCLDGRLFIWMGECKCLLFDCVFVWMDGWVFVACLNGQGFVVCLNGQGFVVCLNGQVFVVCLDGCLLFVWMGVCLDGCVFVACLDGCLTNTSSEWASVCCSSGKVSVCLVDFLFFWLLIGWKDGRVSGWIHGLMNKWMDR